MLVYVWSRRNPYVQMNFFGLLNFHVSAFNYCARSIHWSLYNFQAPYLPWVLLGFSVLLGNAFSVDLIGMAVGHLYYFLEDVFPQQVNKIAIKIDTSNLAPNFRKIFLTNIFVGGWIQSPAHTSDAESTDGPTPRGRRLCSIAWRTSWWLQLGQPAATWRWETQRPMTQHYVLIQFCQFLSSNFNFTQLTLCFVRSNYFVSQSLLITCEFYM